MNKVIVIGRLVKDIELRYTPGGLAIGSATLAVDRNYSAEKRQQAKEKGEPTADFPFITILGKQAENASRYLSKGSKCSIIGEYRTSTYQSANGEKRYKTEVLVESIEFLDPPQKKQDQHEDFSEESYEVEEIPF